MQDACTGPMLGGMGAGALQRASASRCVLAMLGYTTHLFGCYRGHAFAQLRQDNVQLSAQQL